MVKGEPSSRLERDALPAPAAPSGDAQDDLQDYDPSPQEFYLQFETLFVENRLDGNLDWTLEQVHRQLVPPLSLDLVHSYYAHHELPLWLAFQESIQQLASQLRRRNLSTLLANRPPPPLPPVVGRVSSPPPPNPPLLPLPPKPEEVVARLPTPPPVAAAEDLPGPAFAPNRLQSPNPPPPPPIELLPPPRRPNPFARSTSPYLAASLPPQPRPQPQPNAIRSRALEAAFAAAADPLPPPLPPHHNPPVEPAAPAPIPPPSWISEAAPTAVREGSEASSSQTNGRRTSSRVGAQPPRPQLPPSSDSDDSDSQSLPLQSPFSRKRKPGKYGRSSPKPRPHPVEKKKKGEGQRWLKRPLRPKSAGPPPPLSLDERLDWKFCSNCGWRRPLDYDRTWGRMQDEKWYKEFVPNWEEFEDKHRVLCEGCINIFWQKVMKKLPKDVVRIPGLKKQPRGYTLLDVPRSPSVGVEQGLAVWRQKYFMGDLKHDRPNTRALHHGTEADHEPEEKRRVGVQKRGGRKGKGEEGTAEDFGEESDLTDLEDDEDGENSGGDDDGKKGPGEEEGDGTSKDEDASREGDEDEEDEDRCEGPSRNRDQPHSASSKRRRTK